jgi:4-hydroxy-3-methylbut-2-en-1-yl diphosphate reductase
VRLAEVGRRSGARSYLIEDASVLELRWLDGVTTVGVTAGASAPEVLVQGVIDKIAGAFEVTVEDVDTARETVTFKLPRAVA